MKSVALFVLDNRPGDEGGIDLDMVPIYEKAMNSLGYQNATSAITRALSCSDPNEDSNQQQTKLKSSFTKEVTNNNNKSYNSSEEEREVTNMFNGIKIKQERKSVNPGSVAQEPMIKPAFQIKQERKSVYPEVTDTSTQDEEEDENSTPNLNETYELEKDSDMTADEHTAPEDADSVDETQHKEDETVVKAKPVRKSNIRKSWSSPQPLFKAGSR